jgi:hypothetical protein
MVIALDSLTALQPNLASDANVFLKGEHAYPQPSAPADGATFPAIPDGNHIARWKQITVATVVVSALGTSSVLRNIPNPRALPLVGFALELPSTVQHAPPEIAAERYNQLRREIIAAGIPLLGDNELREEIASRRGEREP